MFSLNIISLLSALILFIIIIIFNIKEIRSNYINLKIIITYWFITIILCLFGLIIHVIIFVILQYGQFNIYKLFQYKILIILLSQMMEFSFPSLVVAIITIKEVGYLNNFYRIFLTAITTITIPTIIFIIIGGIVKEPNYIFYNILNSFGGNLLLGIILSLIITKLNMKIFDLQETDKININYYSITATILSIVLLLIIYLFFINQFPSKIIIKLSDWRAISIFYHNEKGNEISEAITADIKSDLSKYRNFKINSLHIHKAIGNMTVNSVNYKLSKDNNTIISEARLNIDKNDKNELVIDVVSRSIDFDGQIITMTIWSSFSSNIKTAIIAGIFAIIAAIITSIAAIIIKINKDN